jgi:phospholipid/cholesterol/gamma-HCH transport system substrate-binding protein
MDSKREQAFVGLFVLVVAALLIATLFALSGTFNGSDFPYRAYFKNAGGLGPGSEVRYAGGPPIGRVRKVVVDPGDPTRMEVDFDAHPDIPIKTDSSVLITSTSPLGENFLGIKPGTAAAPRAPKNYVLKSTEPVSFSDIADAINALTPQANQLLANLNARVVELKDTLYRVNDLLNDKNRENVSASLGHLRGMLQEDRPLVKSTLTNVNQAAEKLNPLIDKFSVATDKADKTLDHLDAMIGDNAREAVTQINGIVNDNSEDIDEILENLRVTTENLNSFTETIKTRPYTLLRDSSPKPHKPGTAPPK